MAVPEEVLRSKLDQLSKKSGGQVAVKFRTLAALGQDLSLDLGKSPNPVFDFTIRLPNASDFRTIAYTILIDGSKRNATRAEALGRGLVVSNGLLFDYNPFLLIYDTSGKQFMAVSAATLFGEFSRRMAKTPLDKPESATFSLTPNFTKRTINMYATVSGQAIWHESISSGGLTTAGLISGLTRMRDETVHARPQIPTIVQAISARIESPGLDQTAASQMSSVLTVPTLESEPEVRVEPRVLRMIMTSIRSAFAVILVGPPGTGKTALLRDALQAVSKDPGIVGLKVPPGAPLWATPDESWTVRELVGGDTIIDGEIQFRPGWVLRAIQDNRWLVLDEANRADMDRIFGGLLTWLAGGTVAIGTASPASDAPMIELGWNVGSATCKTVGINEQRKLVGDNGKVHYLAGTGWRLLGTYNALDAQRVFRFGAALGRRFVRVPIPAPGPTLFAEALAAHAPYLSPSLRQGVNGLYAAHYANVATQLGPALFLSMCGYLRTAMELGVATSGSIEETRTLAEAYVVNIGTWLAHLELRDLDSLGNAIRTSSVFDVPEWDWIRSMVAALA